MKGANPVKEPIGKFLFADQWMGIPDRWAIYAKDGAMLGRVSWYARWRQYVFAPVSTSSVFSHDCLTDLAAFLKARGRDKRAGKSTSDSQKR